MDRKTSPIDLQLLKLQFQQINDKLNHHNNLFEKLFDRMDSMNNVLIKNTAIVDEHQKRSTQMENVMGSYKVQLETLSIKMTKIHGDLERVDADVKPIKAHVAEMTGFMGFVKGMPSFLKIIILLLTLLTSGYGVIKMLQEITVRVIQ